jgi:hypothetical protein
MPKATTTSSGPRSTEFVVTVAEIERGSIAIASIIPRETIERAIAPSPTRMPPSWIRGRFASGWVCIDALARGCRTASVQSTTTASVSIRPPVSVTSAGSSSTFGSPSSGEQRLSFGLSTTSPRSESQRETGRIRPARSFTSASWAPGDSPGGREPSRHDPGGRLPPGAASLRVGNKDVTGRSERGQR